MATNAAGIPVTGFRAKPWVQLVAGIICMAMVANLQYGWTFFVDPIGAAHSWGRAAIQVSFTIFVLFETWPVPFEGFLADKFGPRVIVTVGGILAGIGWVLNSYADSLPFFYFAAIISGIGAGAVYGTCVGNAVKWFARRRGLAAGLTAAGFGAGSALTVIPIQNMILTSGYQHTFLVFGIIQGLIVILVAQIFLKPPNLPGGGEGVPPKVLQGFKDWAPLRVLMSPTFYVMYIMFVLVGAGGLMATAQLAPIAKDFFIDTVPVTLLIWTQTALTFAAFLDRIMNGITRPLLGFISDRIGRENTMFGAFILEGIGIYCLWHYGKSPMAFVLLSAFVFFAWGEIYSLFPSTTRDHFGQKYATANYGMLYTAKGTAALIIPFGNIIATNTGSWQTVLYIASAANIVAAILALVVLRPVRLWEIRKYRDSAVEPPASPTVASTT
jgi:OFA family oxalate/formate antiporter-like MFS transporter